MNLIRRITIRMQLRKLNKISNINRGGCAIIAFCLQDWFKTTHNIESEVIYLFKGISISDFEALQNGDNGSCSHAVLKINNKYYDTTGVYTEKELYNKWDYAELLALPKGKVFKSINYSDQWNPHFDRSVSVTKINKILNTNLQLAS